MDKFMHSVQLDTDACKGCINCIKHCPTQAIRVHNGKAIINDEHCIDCSKCIRHCPHHAKVPVFDSLDVLNSYKYTVALPAPSLYAQFNNLEYVDTVLNALIRIGFDAVYEVSAAAELVSEASRKYIATHKEDTPFISTACPTVVRLIRVKFPSLIPKLLPLKPPVEVAAQLARAHAVKATGLPAKDIGIIFISPCPSKVTYARSPLGVSKSNIDHVVAIKDIYPRLLPHMTHDPDELKALSHSGKIGIGWGSSGGEIAGLLTDSYLAADGIDNIIPVLEDLEDEKLPDIDFIELNSCSGGCVGGVLNVENPYIAITKLKKLNRYLPITRTSIEKELDTDYNWNEKIVFEPVFQLGSTLQESITMLSAVESLEKQLPGLDCGTCGAPTCKALAEDVVRGRAQANDCIYVLKEYTNHLKEELDEMENQLKSRKD